MGIVLLLILGAAIGWIVSIGTCHDDAKCIALNALAGAAGALITALLAHSFLGTSDVVAGAISLGALAAAMLGGTAAAIGLHLSRNRSTV